MYLLTDLIIILVFLIGSAALGFLIGRRSTRGAVEQWRTRWQSQQQALSDAEQRLQRTAARHKTLTHELTEVRTHLSQQGVSVSDLSPTPATAEAPGGAPPNAAAHGAPATTVRARHPVGRHPVERYPVGPHPIVQRTAARSEPRQRLSKQDETLERIRSRAHHINLERIGTASEDQRDDLKRVEGIGIFAEKKLNALGIYTIAQIAHFNDDDQRQINQVMELSEGRIVHDGWVQQAQQLVQDIGIA